MIITFIHNKKAFLPDIDAYRRLFESMGFLCKVALPQEIEKLQTDVEWHFMGLDTEKSKKGRIKIHEYLSGSVGSLRMLRNFSKRFLNVMPDFRLFLNPYVRQQFSFADHVPFGYRDMGVDERWLTPLTGSRTADKKYDFVYMGDISPSRHPELLLNVFSKGAMRDKTLLIISSRYSTLERLYSGDSNIVFKGPFAHNAIPSILQEARYGINYIPDREPFNEQTSTKLLEYAACGLPIVTMRYKWMEEFRLRYGGEYYFLNHDLSNFNWENVTGSHYSAPDLTAWTWEKRIHASGVLAFLQSALTGSG